MAERFGLAHQRASSQSVALVRIIMRQEVLISRKIVRLMAKSSLDILDGSARYRQSRRKRASLAEHRDALWLPVVAVLDAGGRSERELRWQPPGCAVASCYSLRCRSKLEDRKLVSTLIVLPVRPVVCRGWPCVQMYAS